MKYIVRCIIISLTLVVTGSFSGFYAQEISEKDAFFIKSLYEEALQSQGAYDILKDLIETSGGHRLSGTENYDRAADHATRVMKEVGFESVNLQPCEVDQWVRGEDDRVVVFDAAGDEMPLAAVTLGNSGHSDGQLLRGEVVAFNHLDSVATYKGDLVGKIAFFTRPFDQSLINTFRAYSGAVAQRVFGPNAAAKRGAIATVVRSMASNLDDHPHTGVTIFEEGVDAIPALAVSTIAAERLENMMSTGPVVLGVQSDAKIKGNTTDDNVIGQIRGREFPDEIILAGGHLDSWDIGDGAHDDGAGCAHVLEAFRILKKTGYQPKRTWRCVLFANEENGLAGGNEYARISNEKNEYHLAAIESDAGGFTPKSFSFVSDTLLSDRMKNINEFWPLLESYHLGIEFSGAGADISPLKSQGGLLIGFRPDPQRYFDYHHSTNDNLENVNPRELSLGAAAIAGLIYLIDKYGIE